MKVHVGMLGEPGVAFFVRAVVVQNDVQITIRWSVGYDLIHKLEELFSSLQRGLAGLDLACGHLQGGEQVQRAVTFVGALEAAHDLAVVGFHIPVARSKA